MKPHPTAHLIGLAVIACLPIAQAAVTIDPTYTFDWLQYQGSDATLCDKTSSAIASVSFEMRKGKPMALGSSSLAAAEWADPVPLEGTGASAEVVATAVQVMPDFLTSEVDYTLKIQAQPGKSLRGIVLAIGGLDPGSKITISCHNSGGVGESIELIGSSAWDGSGLGVAYNQALLWTSLISALQPTDGASGDSDFGFFRLPDSPVDRLDLVFSSSSPSIYGDSWHVGLALVTVPEPSALALGSFGACLLLRRRRAMTSPGLQSMNIEVESC